MFGMFESGFGVGLQDARAMSEQELALMQARQWHGMRQAAPNLDFANIMNWQPPQRPLDERFADFKIRLAAAIERQRANTASPAQSPSTRTHS